MMVPRPCLMMISARTPIEPVSSTARMIGVESGLASESQDSRTLILVGSSSGASSDWVKSCDRDFDRATRACACQSALDHLAFPMAISFGFGRLIPAAELLPVVTPGDQNWTPSFEEFATRQRGFGTRRSRQPETRVRVEGVAK